MGRSAFLNNEERQFSDSERNYLIGKVEELLKADLFPRIV